MNAYFAEVQNEQARRWETIRYVSFGLLFIIFFIFILVFGWGLRYRENGVFIFSIGVSAVAGILAATYFFTYEFFDDRFYFFIFASWLSNALYLIPEVNGLEPGDDGYLTYRLGIFALSLISSGFLLLALLSPGKKRPLQKTWLVGLVVGVILFAAACVFIANMPEKVKETIEVGGVATQVDNVFPGREHIKLGWIMLVGTVPTFALIWGTGEVLKVRLNGENHGWKKQLLSGTFYLYAILQFVYPIFPFLQASSKNQMLAPFLIAQMAKVGNAISMLGVLQSAITHRDLRRDEEVQKHLEFIELGMVAASIKHDVNTPLSTMGFEIGAMKLKFQQNTEIVKKLEKLEESMERIYAIVKIVDIIRGDKAFFDREQFMRKTSVLEVAHRAVKSLKHERSELKLPNSKYTIKIEGREVWVRAYSPMLEQAVVNVIKNGLEAIDEAKRERGLISIIVGTTSVQGSEYSRWAKVEIKDNGRGIPEEHMSRLTTLFTTRSDRKPNSGIGLFIGKKILDIHSGAIEFESTVDEGTTVTLLLPEWAALQKAAQQTAEIQEAENASPAAMSLPDKVPGVETPRPAPTRKSEHQEKRV